MLTLIKREISDNKVFFILVFILTMILVFTEIFLTYYTSDTHGMTIGFNNNLTIIVIGLLLLISAAMGASQMRQDKNRKVSTFLSTLATTRDQILIARVCAGILAILLFFLPQIAAILILYHYFIDAELFNNLFFDVYLVSSLAAVSCYCIGLHAGWTSKKQYPFLEAIAFAAIIVTIIIIKGIGIQALILLIIFIAASLIRVRQNFITTSF